jgi:predicted Mrr-cat superfamily restriction endonuclease
MKELFNGTLRQGWGALGTQLIDSAGNRLDKNSWLSNYSKAWDNPVDEGEASKRYNILARILEIKKGDIVVIPKTRTGQTLTICTVSKEYWFDGETSTMWSDYRHCIGVENIKSYVYDSCSEAKLISAKFIAYQTAINNVWVPNFIQNTRELYKREDDFNSKTIRQLLLQIRKKSIEKIAPDLLQVNPSSFEDIIAECLETKGYIIADRRKYNGAGADVDIVATFPLPFVTEFAEVSPTILIQVKKKTGIDREDRTGIDQLIKARQNYENPICILLNTADSISDETEKYANKENVKIIRGTRILELILTSDFSKPQQ